MDKWFWICKCWNTNFTNTTGTSFSKSIHGSHEISRGGWDAEKWESERKEEYPEIVLFCVVSQRPCTTSRPLWPDPLTSAIGKTKQSSGLRPSDSRLILHPQNTPQKGTITSPLLIFGIKFILIVRGLFKVTSLSIQKLCINIRLLNYSTFS